MKKIFVLSKLISASLCAALAVGLAGCGSSGKGGSDSKSKKESGGTESVIDGKKVEVYLAEDGTPYYINEDGEKMMLFSTPFADESDASDVGDDSDFDFTQNFIRGDYDSDGLKFTIPDGWFAEASFGPPTLFQDVADGEDINYDEAISIVPTYYVFTDIENGDADKDAVSEYFESLKDSGFYNDFKLVEDGTVTVCGAEAKYFDITATMPNDEGDGENSFRIRYIITPGDNSHCLILSSLDTDESAKKVQDVFDSFADTIQLPTAEQMKDADAAFEEEMSEEEAEEDDGEEITETPDKDTDSETKSES